MLCMVLLLCLLLYTCSTSCILYMTQLNLVALISLLVLHGNVLVQCAGWLMTDLWLMDIKCTVHLYYQTYLKTPAWFHLKQWLVSLTKVKAAWGHMNIDEATCQNWVIGSALISIWWQSLPVSCWQATTHQWPSDRAPIYVHQGDISFTCLHLLYTTFQSLCLSIWVYQIVFVAPGGLLLLRKAPNSQSAMQNHAGAWQVRYKGCWS